MAYEPKPMGNRLGLYADKVEAKRQELGLTRSGFRQDVTDPAKGEKEAMLGELYRRADRRVQSIASALGGPVPPRDSEAEGARDQDEGEEDLPDAA